MFRNYQPYPPLLRRLEDLTRRNNLLLHQLNRCTSQIVYLFSENRVLREHTIFLNEQLTSVHQDYTDLYERHLTVEQEIVNRGAEIERLSSLVTELEEAIEILENFISRRETSRNHLVSRGTNTSNGFFPQNSLVERNNLPNPMRPHSAS